MNQTVWLLIIAAAAIGGAVLALKVPSMARPMKIIGLVSAVVLLILALTGNL